MHTIEPFEISVDDAVLADLRARLLLLHDVRAFFRRFRSRRG